MGPAGCAVRATGYKGWRVLTRRVSTRGRDGCDNLDHRDDAAHPIDRQRAALAQPRGRDDARGGRLAPPRRDAQQAAARRHRATHGRVRRAQCGSWRVKTSRWTSPAAAWWCPRRRRGRGGRRLGRHALPEDGLESAVALHVVATARTCWADLAGQARVRCSICCVRRPPARRRSCPSTTDRTASTAELLVGVQLHNVGADGVECELRDVAEMMPSDGMRWSRRCSPCAGSIVSMSSTSRCARAWRSTTTWRCSVSPSCAYRLVFSRCKSAAHPPAASSRRAGTSTRPV